MSGMKLIHISTFAFPIFVAQPQPLKIGNVLHRRYDGRRGVPPGAAEAGNTLVVKDR